MKDREIELVKLDYADFRELLNEFYHAEEKKFPEDIAECLAKRFLESCGYKVCTLATDDSKYWAEDEGFLTKFL